MVGYISINDHVRTAPVSVSSRRGQSPRTSQSVQHVAVAGDPPGFADCSVKGELGIALHPEHEDAFQYWVLRPGFYVCTQGAKRVQIPYVKMNSTGRACCEPPQKAPPRRAREAT